MKLAVGGQSWEARANHLPPAGLVQLSRERTKGHRAREEGSRQLLVVGSGPEPGRRVKGVRGGPDRWGFVSWMPKQISP